MSDPEGRGAGGATSDGSEAIGGVARGRPRALRRRSHPRAPAAVASFGHGAAPGEGLRDPDLASRCAALTDGEGDAVAVMATLACEIHHADPRCDWTGFYRVVAPGLLKIGPYQGGHGCLAIPFDRGVCGACARTGEPQIVADVEAFPGHIACSSSTRSELVLPVRAASGLIGVLDIDSDRPGAFGPEDAEALGAILAAAFAGVR